MDAAKTGAPAGFRPTFRAGDKIAGRYCILRFVALGGMAEVYEAEDIELRERVALKAIRPELARDPRVLERFRREIHLARLVTHPNVCRIFEFGQHRPEPAERGAGASAPVLFLTMEFL